MRTITAIREMIKQRRTIDVNWINCTTANEIEMCRLQLLDAGYRLDTAQIVPGCESNFKRPNYWMPQETWYPPEEKA